MQTMETVEYVQRSVGRLQNTNLTWALQNKCDSSYAFSTGGSMREYNKGAGK